MSEQLYMVRDGEARELDEPIETDDRESVLVIADTPERALETALAYDRGQIDVDNVIWCGQTVAALRAPITVMED